DSPGGVEELVVERGRVEAAGGAPRVPGDRAGERPADRAIERLRRIALARVEDEGRAPEAPRVVLQGTHERESDATAACAPVDHDLRHLGPVARVRAHGELQLG